jgi:hypothetical protein
VIGFLTMGWVWVGHAAVTSRRDMGAEDRLVRVDMGSPHLAPGGRDGVTGQASQRHQAAPHRGV